VAKQDVDFTELYTDISGIYPNMLVSEVRYVPSERIIKVEVVVNNASTNLKEFLVAVENSKFSKTGLLVKKISFNTQNTSTGGASGDLIQSNASVDLEIINPNLIEI
jgi:hypothetical protein